MDLGHWGVTGGNLKGSQNLSVAVGLVLLGGSAPAASAACCCTQLTTDQWFCHVPKRQQCPLVLGHHLGLHGKWQQLPPFKTRLRVLARALSALAWPSLPAALTCVNQPLSLPVWLFSVGCCAWKVSYFASPDCPYSTSSEKHFSLLLLFKKIQHDRGNYCFKNCNE